MEWIKAIEYFLAEHCTIQNFEIEMTYYTEQVEENVESSLSYCYRFFGGENLYLIVFTEKALNEKQLIILEGLGKPAFLQIELDEQAHLQQVMMESVNAISKVSHNQNDVIQLILTKALHVIKKASLGVIWMKDEENQTFYKPYAWAGGLSDRIQELRFSITEGILGKTIRTNNTIFLTNIKEIIEMSSSISIRNIEILTEVYEYESTRSLISVPIREDGQAIGILIMYQIGHSPRLTKRDVRILESFADQVAIVLKNTKMVANIVQQNEMLLKRDEIHQTFMSLTIEHKGFQAIVSECCKMLGRPVFIYDYMKNKLYDRSGESKDVMLLTKIIQQTYLKNKLVEVNDEWYYVHPIIEKSISLGLIIVKLKENKTSTIQHIVLEQAQTTILLEYIREQSINEMKHQQEKVKFDALVYANHKIEQQKLARQLNMQMDDSHCIAILKMEQTEDFSVRALILQKALLKLQHVLHDDLVHSFIYQSTITILAKANDFASYKKKLVDWIHSYNETATFRLQCGIGNSAEELDLLIQSLEQAQNVLAFLEKNQLYQTMDLKDIGINQLFMQLDEKHLRQYVNEVYEPLMKRPADYILIETLEAYIQHRGAVKRVAEQLHIHTNTLYQRLEKIQARTNLNFSESEDFLKIHLACYLRQQL